jgi:hypothetical protein
MQRDRQANQRRMMLAKASMEEELERMRIYGDFSRLKNLAAPAAGAGGDKGAQRPGTAS